MWVLSACLFLSYNTQGQMAKKSFYFSNNIETDKQVADSIKAFIVQTQSDLVCDCNSQESILSSAINMYVSGSCIYGSTGNTGCSNALEYMWMKCDMDGSNCVEQTGWISGGSGSLCPSTAGWYTFCVRFAGCYSSNVGEVPLQYVGDQAVAAAVIFQQAYLAQLLFVLVAPHR